MDQELQFLINTLYGNKLNEKQLAGIIQMAQQNPQYLLNMRNTANAKMPGSKLDMSNIRANNIASLRTPTLGRTDFNNSTANKGVAKNDMSAIADFKQAFRQARQGGHKTFFWKKTKANPSGMFSTETKPQESVKVNNSKVFLDTDKTDIPAFTGQYPEQFDVNSPRIPIQGPIQHAQMDDTNFVPRIPILGKTDLGIFKKQNPVEVNISDSNRIAGRNYGEGQKNANLYFGRKGMFANGGTIDMEQLITQLVQAAAGGDQQATQQIEQIMQAAQQGNQEAILIAQIILKVIQTMKQQKGIKAALGAKLDYINKLKGNCPEGEELVYMKQGGRVCPVCQKKAEKAENGKKLPKKNAVSDFKEKRKQINPNDTVNTKFGPRDLNGKTKYPKYNAKKENYNFETRMRVQEKDEKSGKKVIGSACGSKMKKK